MNIFQRKHISRNLRVAAVKAIIGMQIEEVKYAGIKSKLILFLRDRLQDQDAKIRTLALDVISQSLGNAAIRYDKYDKFFSRAIRDTDKEVRRSGLKSLGRLGHAAGRRFAVQVAHALEDVEDDIKHQASETMVQIEPSETSAPLFIKRFLHKNGNTRFSALSAFVAIFGQRLKHCARKHTKSIVPLWSDVNVNIRRLAIQFTHDHLCGSILEPYNEEIMNMICDEDMLAQTTAVQVLRKSPNLKFAENYMHRVAELIEDGDAPVRAVVVEALSSLYRFAVEHRQNLLKIHENGRLQKNQDLINVEKTRVIEKKNIQAEREDNKTWLANEKKICRSKIIQLQTQNSKLSTEIQSYVKEYKSMVDKIKMERIERRYASQELERMLSEARAGVGELTKEEVIQKTLDAEEKERIRERERSHRMMEVRNKERDLINIRTKHEREIEIFRDRLEKNHKIAKFKEIELAKQEYANRVGLVNEEFYQFDVKMKNVVYAYEKYKRLLVQSTNTSRPVPIRVSALHALKAVHTKWEGTIYEKDVEKCLDESERSEIKSAAVSFLLHTVYPDSAFKYSRIVVRDTPALCSKTRGAATDGLMALGAVATQLGGHFVGAHAVYPKKGTYAIPRTFYKDGEIGLEKKLTQVFQMLDTDGSGSLDKREVSKAIMKSQEIRNILRTHPALERFLHPPEVAKDFYGNGYKLRWVS
eukprot:g1882.t1